MTATETAQKRANKILADARKNYSTIVDEIGKFEIQEAAAAEAMTKAGDACDLDAYNKARADKQAAEGALEMYRAKAEKLEGEPLIEQAEYNKLCDDIQQEFADYIETLRADLYDITAQLIDKYETAHRKIKDANRALHALQFDVARGCFDVEYYGKNRDQVLDSSKKTVGTRAQYDVLEWANSISKTMYEKMKREREGAGNE